MANMSPLDIFPSNSGLIERCNILLNNCQKNYAAIANIYPIDNLSSNDPSKTLSANMGKNLNDSKIEKSMIVDKLDSTDPSSVLSANQGNVLSSFIGDIYSLETQNKSSLVLALNEVNSKETISVADNLTTADAYMALSANQGVEISKNIGDLDTLDTTDKTSIVSALNEINSKEQITIADNLITTDPGCALSANQGVNLIAMIGDTSVLETEEKSSLVTAVNELNSRKQIEVVDNLETADTQAALSANQGAVLNITIGDINRIINSEYSDKIQCQGDVSVVAVLLHVLEVIHGKEEKING